MIWADNSARYLQSHGGLLWRVTRNELIARHAGSLLGLGWLFLGPLLILAIYAMVYLLIFRVQVPGLSSQGYVLYIFAGLVPFLATAEAISTGTSSVVGNRSILNNPAFPIDLAPVKAALASQVTMLVGLMVIVIGLFAIGSAHPTLALVPFVWALHVIFVVGVNWFLSLLTVVFRDLQNLVTAILMLMLVASPIAYTPAMVPPELAPLITFNPFAYFVTAYQKLLVLGELPTPSHLITLVLISVIAFGAGSWFFGAAKRALLDYV
jgi:lipopolysaccharide transport system permease protein